MHNKLNPIVVVLVLATLSACGFHLRGALQLDPTMSPVAITGLTQGNELVVELGRRVVAQKLTLDDNPQNARTVILLSDERTDRSVSAIGPDGRAREIRLNYGITLDATRDNGQRITAQKINLTRDFAVDPNKVLAAGEAEIQLQKDMQHEAAYTILRALESLKPVAVKGPNTP